MTPCKPGREEDDEIERCKQSCAYVGLESNAIRFVPGDSVPSTGIPAHPSRKEHNNRQHGRTTDPDDRGRRTALPPRCRGEQGSDSKHQNDGPEGNWRVAELTEIDFAYLQEHLERLDTGSG